VTGRYLSLADLEEWVDNDADLYGWWRAAGWSRHTFVCVYQDELRDAIRRYLGQGGGPGHRPVVTFLPELHRDDAPL
jgi:hypothetical protein